MTRICVVVVLVASACFTVLAEDVTTTSKSTSNLGSSTTTKGSEGSSTRRVERQVGPDSDESSEGSFPNGGNTGNGGSDDGQNSGQQRSQPPFQPRPMRQTRPRPQTVPEQPQGHVEDTTRLLRQANDDQQQDQFQAPRRPGPAPRPGQRPGPGPSRPQPQPGPGTSALTLPDGVDLIIGAVQPGFSCDQRIYGYYADTLNDCRLFHVCVPNVDPNGIVHNQQWSFICGNTTRFNQELLICDHEDNVDCSQAENFYNVNENFGRPEDKTGAPARG